MKKIKKGGDFFTTKFEGLAYQCKMRGSENLGRNKGCENLDETRV